MDFHNGRHAGFFQSPYCIPISFSGIQTSWWEARSGDVIYSLPASSEGKGRSDSRGFRLRSQLYGVPVETFLELVVTYHINMDFALKQQGEKKDMDDDLSFFLEFINAPENSKKFKFLSRRERHLLFYYLLLDTRDQDDILAFMKVKYQSRKNEKKSEPPA